MSVSGRPVRDSERARRGSFSSAVWEALNAVALDGPDCARIMRAGPPDRYVTPGRPTLLHEEVGFTGKVIVERIAAAVGAGPALSGA